MIKLTNQDIETLKKIVHAQSFCKEITIKDDVEKALSYLYGTYWTDSPDIVVTKKKLSGDMSIAMLDSVYIDEIIEGYYKYIVLRNILLPLSDKAIKTIDFLYKNPDTKLEYQIPTDLLNSGLVDNCYAGTYSYLNPAGVMFYELCIKESK